jgi:S-DNA-T family DNA segregation ATPase FtsK/SpoIIIE
MIEDTLYLKDCLKEVSLEDGFLPIVLGRNKEEGIIIKDLVEIRNILVTGVTGTGKSVFLNSIIYTLTNSKDPEQLKLVLIDPKIAEFNYIWNDSEYLLRPIITKMIDASATLKFCMQEMQKRFKELESNRITLEELPFIVIIIDELSDLMLSEHEISSRLYELAKRGYLVNIHMILSTSSPRSNVFTRELSELIPGRVTGALSTKKESIKILGKSGAEELSGNGDMLYKDSSLEECIRLQMPYISQEEISNLNKI